MFLGRVVLPSDPQWTDDDRAKVRAVFRDRAHRCSKCGTIPEDAFDEHGRPVDEWEAETICCRVCELAERAMYDVPPSRKGISVRIVKAKPLEEEGDI